MDIETLLSYQWGIMAPEFTILIAATLLSLLDLFMSKKQDRKILIWLGLAGILIALIFLLRQLPMEPTMILHETYRLDAFSKSFKLIFLVGTALIFLMALSYKPKEGMSQYRGEFYYLLLAALLGAMMMASSADLITLFIGLELLSISSYILAGIRKYNKESNEAAMKYVINGAISTAITLFGLSYIYGLSGTTNLYEIGVALSQLSTTNSQFLLAIAFLMVFVGLTFKIAAAPFHMWSPDVYQGSPIPVTAFLSVVSKAAGFVIIVRIFITIFLQAPAIGGHMPLLVAMQDYIAVLAGLTMIIGNTVALKQNNIKRLLAYSSIAHAGYLLVPFVALSAFMFEGFWFYLVAYLFMNIGAFAIIQAVSQKENSADISIFKGLYHRSPFIAVVMSIFLLSLAGIPATAGFIGKLNIFVGALSTEPGHYILAAIMMATTVVSYYYYFGVMKQMFMRTTIETEKVQLPSGIAIIVAICAIGTIALGIFPNIAFDFFYQNFDFTEFFG